VPVRAGPPACVALTVAVKVTLVKDGTVVADAVTEVCEPRAILTAAVPDVELV